MKLVIVESPTKAKTITKYLPKDYVVESSLGHIRDLPQSATEIPAKYKTEKWSRLGVDVNNDFTPLYIVPKDKKKHVAKLKKLVKDADEIYLATDEDREGEAISWHLIEVLKPAVTVKRMVFHEITKKAILHALETPREIDMNLVEAQETRRILDRLYGYEVSPILWRKVAPKLSAGRVQSAALKLIVEREKERMAFVGAEYWDITGSFNTKNNESFEAKLTQVDGKRVATGKDFDAATGKLTEKAEGNVTVVDAERANTLAESLANSDWNVASVQQKPLTLSPRPPFITSTIQQEAGRKLRWSARQTMRSAQKLYEKGYITYMRTDSVQLSQEAIDAARAKIAELYGKDYVPDEPRKYKSSAKNAQEAHEAIRPAGSNMRTPEELGADVTPDERKLYDLIWKRTVASQMANAKVKQTTVQLKHEDTQFNASGRVVEFPGYLKAYVESSDNPEETANDSEKLLPKMEENDTVTGKTFESNEHTTKPPARFTEASLVKALEGNGIGRPSTYATIIDTIQRRWYVYKEGSALVPRFIAFGVVNLLGINFPDLVSNEYTAKMEEDLDEIAAGSREHIPYLKSFYFGNDSSKGLHAMLEVDIDARATCTIPIGKDESGHAVNVRVGRYGPFVEQVIDSENENTASIPEDLPPDQLTVEMALEFIKKQAEGPKKLGEDPETGLAVYVVEGRFGPYVQLGEKLKKEKKEDKKAKKDAKPELDENGKPVKKKKKPKPKKPKMKGLLKDMTIEDITLEMALKLLSYPKSIGKWKKTDEDIIADLGRYGPYLKCGEETRSLSAEDNLLELTIEKANIMFDTPKVRGARAKVLREVGKHPEDEVGIKVYKGRYGPYLKYGKINVSIPDTIDPEKITMEQSLELIAAKEAKS